MQTLLRAIEVTGTIDRQRTVRLDLPADIELPSRFRAIILIQDEGDVDDSLWQKAAAANPAFAFLADAEEDIYTLSDGRPFDSAQ